MEFKVGPKYAGKYCIGGECGFCVFLVKKPNKVQRFFMKHLLGWEWYNN
jgi:hypothetical protein